MKAREFNRIIRKNPDDIMNVEFKVDLPIVNHSHTYSLISLRDFVFDQFQKWSLYDNLPNELYQSRSYFGVALEGLERIANEIQNNNSVFHIVDEIQNSMNSNSNNVLTADSPEASLLLSIKDSQKALNGAFRFYTNQLSYSGFGDSKYVEGVMLAVIFKAQENSIINRLPLDRASFSSMRSRIEKHISTSVSDIDELLNNGIIRINNSIGELNGLREHNDQIIRRWLEQNRLKATNLTNEVNEERNNIERTYKELLQLQEPAKHWRDTSEKLINEGHMFMRGLFALILVGGFCLYMLLWKTPEGMLEGFFDGNKVAAIRWSIVFVTFISLFFVGVHALRKAMFSSFHLARDAQEREKLTMYYLSLIKEGGVGNEDRSLILQSLFSRADSGLLKEDSSPTMPGIFDKVAKQ